MIKTSYAKKAPTFIRITVGGSGEIAKWVLDHHDILYHDQPHAPGFYTSVVSKLTAPGGNPDSHPRSGRRTGDPILIRTDALLPATYGIVEYLEQKSLPCNRLLPADPVDRELVEVLYDLFTGQFADNVNRYVYAQLRAVPDLARALFTQRAPFREKLMYRIGYGTLRKNLDKELAPGSNPLNIDPQRVLIDIKAIFRQVDVILEDGRKYLTGHTLTLADIAFAAIAAPFVLPEEFGGAMCRINQIPGIWRTAVIDLRATPAGQFILRLYQEDRPVMRPQNELPPEPGIFGLLGERVSLLLAGKKTSLFSYLQKRFPVLKVPFTPLMTVNRNDLLVELMQRDTDFTIEEINGRKMANQKGAFFLGMDRMNPQFDRERDLIRKSAKREDLEMIRIYIRTSSAEILQQAQSFGKIDVADTLCRTVLVRFIENYFGVPGPTETIMKAWLRALFYDLFLNFTNNAAKHQAALDAANQRKAWLEQLIRDRKRILKEGGSLDDNVLNRLIFLQQQPGNEWFNDDMLQRNMGGLITGILETTNKAVILVLDELFNRPGILPGAIACAQQMDMKKMYGYVSEALRFNPAQPGIIRYSENRQTIRGKGGKAYTIPAGSIVFALTAAAMMDPAAFPDPRKFDPEREAVYMNYGYALHECYGKYINAVTISEFVAAVLRLKNPRRESGRTGRGTGLQEGPFPNNFVVAFDAAF